VAALYAFEITIYTIKTGTGGAFREDQKSSNLSEYVAGIEAYRRGFDRKNEVLNTLQRNRFAETNNV
jgi:hypothetical protein